MVGILTFFSRLCFLLIVLVVIVSIFFALHLFFAWSRPVMGMAGKISHGLDKSHPRPAPRTWRRDFRTFSPAEYGPDSQPRSIFFFCGWVCCGNAIHPSCNTIASPLLVFSLFGDPISVSVLIRLSSPVVYSLLLFLLTPLVWSLFRRSFAVLTLRYA